MSKSECTPSPKWVIPHLIPEGLTVLTGLPHTWKSALAYHLAASIAQGSSALGQYPTTPMKAVITRFEDSCLNKRYLATLLGDSETENLTYATPMPSFSGGMLWFEKIVEDVGVKLIVLDNWNALCPGGLRDADHRDLLSDIRNVALQSKAAVVVIVHTEPFTDSRFADIADTALVHQLLWTGSFELQVIGPESKKLTLEFNQERWSWAATHVETLTSEPPVIWPLTERPLYMTL